MKKPAGERAAGTSEHRGASRALKILEFLAHNTEGFTLTELSRKLQVPKSSLLALLRTFTDHGYLEHRAGGAYRLGPKAIALGIRSPSQRELPALAGPVLLDLMEKSGETVCLGALAHDAPEIVYIDTVESRQQIRYSARLGERRPLYCTAPGLVLLAFMPTAERDRLRRSLRLLPLTARTCTDRDVLRARLDEVRKAGMAVSVDEFIMGASAIAAPIFDRQGRAVAACTVVGPTPRLLAQRERLVKLVKAAGESVTRSLGFLPGPRAAAEDPAP
jgi:DNA-binding IclR family transcriptional regulator